MIKAKQAMKKEDSVGKNLFIAEKPSVAKEFAKALKLNTSSRDGYIEAPEAIVTW